MRIFWAIIAVLTIAALAAWFTRGRGPQGAPSEIAAEPSARTTAPPPALPKRSPTADELAAIDEQAQRDEAAKKFRAAAEAAGLRDEPSSIPSPPSSLIPPKPESAPAQAANPEPPLENSQASPPAPQPPVETQTTKPAPTTTEPAKTEPTPPPIDTKSEAATAPKPTEVPPEFFTDLDSALNALVGDPEAPKPAPVAAAADAPKPADAKPVAPAAAQAPLPPAKIVPQPDGSVMIDDKYPLKGKGTKDDPYRMTWDQLVSAERTYQPRLGRKQIPDRVKMLDGKWIRIGGYIAFPLMAQSADEMLMMLNQWDGCCIGVPPTPYDAIEVKLKKAVKGDDRLRTTGTLTGILRVDPYLVKDWLVSLYVMDDGELSDLGGEAPPPPEVHGK